MTNSVVAGAAATVQSGVVDIVSGSVQYAVAIGVSAIALFGAIWLIKKLRSFAFSR